jgi:hypothetical protein
MNIRSRVIQTFANAVSYIWASKTGVIFGRHSAGEGLGEEIEIGTGLALTGNTLSATTQTSGLQTTGLTALNMLRVAAAGGIEQRTPAQVLTDIGAVALISTAADIVDDTRHIYVGGAEIMLMLTIAQSETLTTRVEIFNAASFPLVIRDPSNTNLLTVASGHYVIFTVTDEGAGVFDFTIYDDQLIGLGEINALIEDITPASIGAETAGAAATVQGNLDAVTAKTDFITVSGAVDLDAINTRVNALPSLNNYAATAAPTVTDDAAAGYEIGSIWIDTTNDEAWRCTDSTTGAALWIETTLDTAEVAALIAAITPASIGAATAAQGDLATSALQPDGDGSGLTGLLSAQISDATSSATGDTIVKRDIDGGASFSSSSGTSIYGYSDSGTAIFGDSDSGNGIFGYSDSGNGIYGFSEEGNHANFGNGKFVIANNGDTTLTGNITVGAGTWDGETFTGAQAFSGEVSTQAITEGVVAIGTVVSSHTLAITSGTVLTATLTASTACTFTMPPATAGKFFTLYLKQAAATGNGTATFTGVKFSGDTAPTITATAGRMDIISFVADGSMWYASVLPNITP